MPKPFKYIFAQSIIALARGGMRLRGTFVDVNLPDWNFFMRHEVEHVGITFTSNITSHLKATETSNIM